MNSQLDNSFLAKHLRLNNTLKASHLNLSQSIFRLLAKIQQTSAKIIHQILRVTNYFCLKTNIYAQQNFILHSSVLLHVSICPKPQFYTGCLRRLWATRRNIWFAGLTNSIDKTEILVVSDGQQHWRTWKDKQKTFFLIADFATAGDEMFLSSHYAPYRKPIKKDDIISGEIELRLK